MKLKKKLIWIFSISGILLLGFIAFISQYAYIVPKNNYDEIMNEIKARGKDKVSYAELTEILEKIEKDRILDIINYQNYP